MRHEKIKELLPLFIDDQLTEQEKILVDDHLQDCDECRQELQQYQENHNLLLSLKNEKPPADFANSVLNKVNQIKKEDLQNNNKDESFLNKIRRFFTLPVRIPAGVIGLTAVIIIISLAVLPGILNSSFTNNYLQRRELSNYQSESLKPDYQPAPSPDVRMKIAESPAQQNDTILNDKSLNQEFEQKIIKRANLIIELNEIENIDTRILNLVENYNGYISNSRNWLNYNKQKFYRFELRIPADNFNQILEQFSEKTYGRIISRTISSQDVTEEYMNLDIRLDNLLSQEKRYRQLLDKAEDVEDILKIENELNRIRTEIESLQGRKKYLDNRIGFSTITVEFHQPTPISSGTPGIIRAIRNAINIMIDQFYKIIIIIGTLIPYLLLLLIGYFIYKKTRKN